LYPGGTPKIYFKLSETNYGKNGVTRWVCDKIAQNVAQPIFCKHLYINLNVLKSSPIFLATSVIFKKLANKYNHSIGENSPNLVTLCISNTLKHSLSNAMLLWKGSFEIHFYSKLILIRMACAYLSNYTLHIRLALSLKSIEIWELEGVYTNKNWWFSLETKASSQCSTVKLGHLQLEARFC
jgi:hypothetical protein